MSTSLSTILLHGSLLHFQSFSQLQVWFIKCFCFSDSQRSNSLHSIPMLDVLLSVFSLSDSVFIVLVIYIWITSVISQIDFNDNVSKINSVNFVDFINKLTKSLSWSWIKSRWTVLASLLSLSGYHFKVVLTHIVYIFSEKQTFLNRVFSLDETNPVKANPVAEIDAFSNKFIISLKIIVNTLNISFSKINITELHLIKYCKGLI
jgi:hypothetical protein